MDGNSVAGKYAEELKATAKALVAGGKGILAADESTGTVGKRVRHNLNEALSSAKNLAARTLTYR